MNYAEMKELLEYYVDDVVDNPIATRLFNEGKNRMALAVHAKFPDIANTVGVGDTFVFDDRFHNIPVLYAAAMVKSYDSSLQEKQSYQNDFEMALRDFVENYDPPVQYSTEDNLQHFVVDDNYVTTPVFSVTRNGYNMFGNVSVYVDGVPAGHQKYGSEIRLYETPPLGSIVTIEWEQDTFSGVPRYLKGF